MANMATGEMEETSASEHSDGRSVSSSPYKDFSGPKDKLQALLLLVNRLKFANQIPDLYTVRDFAEIESVPISRGVHFQTRKLKRTDNRVLAKYPAVSKVEETNLEISDESYAALVRELLVLSHKPILQHPNIVDILGIGWTRLLPTQPYCLPVTYLEFAELGTLADYLCDNALTIKNKISLACDVAMGLQMLHDCKITHGDLKLENVIAVLREDGSVVAKLVDFGSSLIGDSENASLPGGTPPWNAPEWQKYMAPSFQRKTDVYSLGLLVWRLMLDGANPFEGEDFEEVDRRKTADVILQEAEKSLEHYYEAQVLSGERLSTSKRYELYLFTVAMPQNAFKHSLRMWSGHRDLRKVVESLSIDALYGFERHLSFLSSQLTTLQGISDTRNYGLPNYRL